MLECTKCKESKDFSEFHKDKSKRYGVRERCKVCIRSERKVSYDAQPEKFRSRTKYNYDNNTETIKDRIKKCNAVHYLDHHIVYYLPIPNYCGVTLNPTHRMHQHKFDGNDTAGWITLAKAKTKNEALSIEAQYHALGMDGAKGYQNKLN